MTDRVPTQVIETIVGADRHATDHIARAVSADQTVYILHSQLCLDTEADLRDCKFSVALNYCGIDLALWAEDVPLKVIVRQGQLVPAPVVPEPDGMKQDDEVLECHERDRP